MQARCLLFEFQRRRYRAEDPSVGRNDFFNRLIGPGICLCSVRRRPGFPEHRLADNVSSGAPQPAFGVRLT